MTAAPTPEMVEMAAAAAAAGTAFDKAAAGLRVVPVQLGRGQLGVALACDLCNLGRVPLGRKPSVGDILDAAARHMATAPEVHQ